MNKIRIPADSLLWLNKKLERKKMKYKIEMLDVAIIFLGITVLAAFLFAGRVVYLNEHFREPCAEICAPNASQVSALISYDNVSCICDLTKERVEVP